MGNPIPEHFSRVNVALAVDGAADAIKFYVDVFGAVEQVRVPGSDGKVAYAELQIGDSVVRLSDEYPEMGFSSPKAFGGTAVTISVYVEDADAAFQAALDRGAVAQSPVDMRFFGVRYGQFEDPWCHRWGVATHIEDVSPKEIERRATEMFGG